jgi:hypothetical protein
MFGCGELAVSWDGGVERRVIPFDNHLYKVMDGTDNHAKLQSLVVLKTEICFVRSRVPRPKR